jgi:sec-independent protein translocase protein TatC
MGLLTRGPARSQVRDDKSMTVIEHLEELRRALIIIAVAWLACTVAAWFFKDAVLGFLEHRASLPRQLVVLSPTGAFMISLKIAIYVGIALSAPIIFWQAWWFVSPGLKPNEQRLILPLIVATSFFFLLGVGFSFFSLPLIMRVMMGFFSPSLLTPMFTADEFIGFVLTLCLAFGVVFELPVVLWVLGMLRIVTSRWLYRTHAYWLVGLGLLANVMTPGADPLTPLIVFVPLVVFWEGTTLLLRLTGR